MKWSHESRWITGGFFLTLIVTGMMSFTSYQNSMQLVNSAAQASQTNELLDALTDISVILANVESRQWRYIFFENASELTQYRTAVRQLNLVLEKLQEPLADTFIQQQRLNALEILIIERLQLFDKAIALYGRRKIKVLSTDLLIARTQQNLDRIHHIIAELEHTEEELIDIQLQEVSFNSRIRMVIEPVGTLVTFSILLSLFWILYGQLLKRQKAEVLQQSLAQEKELSDLKLQLFSMVSHEFRTPLSSILGSSQLLEESLQERINFTQLKNLHRIQSSAKVLTQLLNDILMVARADAGEIQCNPKRIEIQTFCLNLVEDFQVSQSPDRSIAFTRMGDRTHAYVDEKLLYSVLSNLLSNAVKFSPEKSTVYFTLLNNSDAITFQIRDEGIGIPAADRSRLYEPFRRGSNVGEARGTGLGLAVVRRCLQLMKGEIFVQSEVDVGTTFTVTIPQINTH